MIHITKNINKKLIDWHKFYADLQGPWGVNPILLMIGMLSEEYKLPGKFYKDVEHDIKLLEKYRKVEEVYRNFYMTVKDVPNIVIHDAAHECVKKLTEIVKS